METAPGKQQVGPWRSPRELSSKTAVMASAVGLIIGGPLLFLMGISFAATLTLLLVATPLFLVFFPVLFGAVCVIGLAMLGFAASGAMAVAGVSAVAWVIRSAMGGRDVAQIGGEEVEGGKGIDWAGYVQQKPYHAGEKAPIHGI